MEHLKLFVSCTNIPKVHLFISFKSVCADMLLQDNAALTMIERSSDAWDHNQFKNVIVRVANVEMWVPQMSLNAQI
jgi:clathrin heavy chain